MSVGKSSPSSAKTSPHSTLTTTKRSGRSPLPQLTVVVGAQWGDEGKGKITDYFAGDCDFVVRFQGGPNAGHTIMVGSEVYKLHHIPSGVFYDRPISVIGCGVVINPAILLDELAALRQRGITPRLKISARAHVIFPYHVALDHCLSGHQGPLAAGSTGRGIAPVYADKMYRHGIRMGDLLEPDIFAEKLRRAYDFNVSIIETIFRKPFTEQYDDLYRRYLAFGGQLAPYVAEVEREMAEGYRAGRRFLFEAAQGMSLDVDHGLYPHTTSSTTIAGHISAGTGVGFNGSRRVIGVAKAYVTRVGISPFPTEITGEFAERLRERGQEYGTTTGRPRRVGHLDLVQLRQAVDVNGLTEIALTKSDVLAGLGDLNICVAYEIDGAITHSMPSSLRMMRKARPVYRTLPGWPSFSPAAIEAICAGGHGSLPDEVKSYIAFIEEETHCPVSLISLGPDRTCTVVRPLLES